MGLIVCDIDGTVADCTHRLHHIQGEKKDWDAFYKACGEDKPIIPTIRVIQALARDHDIVFLTGRQETEYMTTFNWLQQNIPMGNMAFDLFMRKRNDWSKDHVFKKRWYNDLSQDLQNDIVAVFEDRSQVVTMWRELGLTCYQVAQGDF